jgi:hypothetical protein|tara:strand:+ start:407 stop:625 length:219 start_codon:yes stop_codon:yes gene_type:complete
MTYTIRSNEILTALKSLQDALINEQYDIKDLIIENAEGGKRVYNPELRQEFNDITEELLLISNLIIKRENAS